MTFCVLSGVCDQDGPVFNVGVNSVCMCMMVETCVKNHSSWSRAAYFVSLFFDCKSLWVFQRLKRVLSWSTALDPTRICWVGGDLAKREFSRGSTLVNTGVYVYINVWEFVQLDTYREDRLWEEGLEGWCLRKCARLVSNCVRRQSKLNRFQSTLNQSAGGFGILRLWFVNCTGFNGYYIWIPLVIWNNVVPIKEAWWFERPLHPYKCIVCVWVGLECLFSTTYVYSTCINIQDSRNLDL